MFEYGGMYYYSGIGPKLATEAGGCTDHVVREGKIYPVYHYTYNSYEYRMLNVDLCQRLEQGSCNQSQFALTLFGTADLYSIQVVV